ncbi:MAG: diphosphomevalonate decarboxylase [Candidatus Micrarchaeaceae archaeon]
MKTFTAVSHANIAFVKYWGRKDSKINLPYNTSVSMTLDDKVATTTSLAIGEEIKKDLLFINSKPVDFSSNEKSKYIKRCIDYMRELAKADVHFIISSYNNFPTGAGLASSASGSSALVYLLNKALGLGLDEKEISRITRTISGSGCRSIYGGFVKWSVGDENTSYATQIRGDDHWKELVDMIVILSEDEKKVSSSEGHDHVVSTSELFKERPNIAERHAMLAERAIIEKDFDTLAEVIMRDSNSMHAINQDAYPPINYLNSASIEIIRRVHELNKGKLKAAYTFDAGPSPHIITLEEHVDEVKEILNGIENKGMILAHAGSAPRMVDKNLIEEFMIKEAVG